MNTTPFFQEACDYLAQISQFSKQDWWVYIVWVGTMVGLLFGVSTFLWVGRSQGAQYPAYVWNIPLGIFIFVAAIAVDTIGHRTRYKRVLKKGEGLVHHITIFAGVTSVLALIMGYYYPDFFRYPAITLVALAIFYSVIDEAMHWQRYLKEQSDRIEMWSHFFIFLGHLLMSLSWCHWFLAGYPGL